MASARRLRDDLQAESRQPDHLPEFTKQARAELGAAGDHLLAARAEKLREEWVKRQLVDAGTARAQALGWPDAYPFTKALGERALVATASVPRRRPTPVPITIVRPSIIESALAEPRPGWIRGFRMAEPIIISYARGLLREFPGVPEGVIDVIPVDLVVAAILAVAAARARTPTARRVFHVASGVRNPLALRPPGRAGPGLVRPPPALRRAGPADHVPAWSFPGPGPGPTPAAPGHQGHGRGRAADHHPAGPGQAGRAGRPGWRTATALAKRALGYVELYGAYTETEARYRVDRLLALWDTLDDERPGGLLLRPGRHRLGPLRLTTSTSRRWSSTPGCAPPRRKSTVDKPAGPGPQGRSCPPTATWPSSTSSTRSSRPTSSTPTPGWPAVTCRRPSGPRSWPTCCGAAPSLLALDRRDRGDFLRSFYRRYEGAPVAELEADAWELFHRQLLTPLVPGRPRPGPPAPPPRPPHPAHHRGARLRGRPAAPALRRHRLRPAGRARRRASPAAWRSCRRSARPGRSCWPTTPSAHGLSLAESVAYADSSSDLAMLEAVGFPVAVNPEARLAAIARRRGWHVEHWKRGLGRRPTPRCPSGPARATRSLDGEPGHRWRPR